MILLSYAGKHIKNSLLKQIVINEEIDIKVNISSCLYL